MPQNIKSSECCDDVHTHTHTHTLPADSPKTLATKPRGYCEAKVVRNQGGAYKLGAMSCCSR